MGTPERLLVDGGDESCARKAESRKDYLGRQGKWYFMTVQIPDGIAAIVAELNRRWGVDALWIFGSRATGSARSDSDWDLAVLFKTKPDPAELLGARGEFEVLAGAPVDIVDLDRASPIVAFQVAKQGQLIIENNRQRRVNFIAHVPGRYEDLRIIRRSAERALMERLRHG